MKVYRITLVIEVSDEDNTDPGKWEFADLLDVPAAKVEASERIDTNA